MIGIFLSEKNEHILKLIKKICDQEKIDTKDKKFDPNIHQAMSEVEDPNVKTGTIIQEIQAGYMLGDRLLRPALVAVSKRNSVKNEEIEDKK